MRRQNRRHAQPLHCAADVAKAGVAYEYRQSLHRQHGAEHDRDEADPAHSYHGRADLHCRPAVVEYVEYADDCGQRDDDQRAAGYAQIVRVARGRHRYGKYCEQDQLRRSVYRCREHGDQIDERREQLGAVVESPHYPRAVERPLAAYHIGERPLHTVFHVRFLLGRSRYEPMSTTAMTATHPTTPASEWS